MQYFFCGNCLSELSGLALEIYITLSNIYRLKESPIEFDKDLSVVIKFLEKKGFLYSHEYGDKLYAIPRFVGLIDSKVFCRGFPTENAFEESPGTAPGADFL